LKKRTEGSTINTGALRATPHFQHWGCRSPRRSARWVHEERERSPSSCWFKGREASGRSRRRARDRSLARCRFDVRRGDGAGGTRRRISPGAGVRVSSAEGEGARRELGLSPQRTSGRPICRSALDQLARAEDAVRGALPRRGEPTRRARGHDARRQGVSAAGGRERARAAPPLFAPPPGRTIPRPPTRTSSPLGANAATLHHIKYGRKIAGARPARRRSSSTRGADVSRATARTSRRTFVKGAGAGGRRRFGSLVESVEKFQKQLCNDVAIGKKKYEALHEQAHREGRRRAARRRGSRRSTPRHAVSSGRHPRVLPARPRPLARPAVPRTSACALVKPKPREPVPPQHHDDRRRSGSSRSSPASTSSTRSSRR